MVLERDQNPQVICSKILYKMDESRVNVTRGINTQAWSPKSLKHLGITMELLKALDCFECETFNNCTAVEFVPLGIQ